MRPDWQWSTLAVLLWLESPRVTSNLGKSDGLVYCSVKNAAVCMKTIVKESRKFELARLKKKEEEERKKNIWPVLQVLCLVLLRCFLTPLGVLLVIQTLEDEWYVVIKAYKLAVFEILGDFFVLPYIACPRYPYIRVYRLYDNYKNKKH